MAFRHDLIVLRWKHSMSLIKIDRRLFNKEVGYIHGST